MRIIWNPNTDIPPGRLMGACVSAYIDIYDEYSVDSRSVVRLRFDYLRTARKFLYRSASAPSGFHSPPLEDCSSPSQTALTASVDDRFLWMKIFIEICELPETIRRRRHEDMAPS
jgi:hypothetical protein